MSPDPPGVASPAAPPARRGDRITYGAVHLGVVDLERSLAFWREEIGLVELPGAAGEARLGVDGRPLVVLRADALGGVARGHTGLYHLAIHLPDAVEFARMLVRIERSGTPHSVSDHGFSKAVYLHDPDGIMLELTLETPERYRSIEIGPDSAVLIERDGRRRAPTEPLDVAAAVAPLRGREVDGPLPSGSYVGHVHLHVASLEDAHRFYRDVIGFEEHAFMAAAGIADLRAGGVFPHRIAINDWQGPGAGRAPEATAGMRHFELVLHDRGQLEELEARAAGAGGRFATGPDGVLSLRDPSGNEMTVVQASK